MAILSWHVLIDGIRPCDLLAIKLKNLKADLYKVRWHDSFTRNEYQVALGDFVNSVSSGRVIMCHCDSKEALFTGMPLKIYSYQGRFLDGITRKRRASDVVEAKNLQQTLSTMFVKN